MARFAKAGLFKSHRLRIAAVQFGPDLRGKFEGSIGGWHAAIDRALQDDFLDQLSLRPMRQCRAYMHFQLVFAIERNQHGDRQQAPRRVIDRRTRPYFTPRDPGDQVLELGRKIRGR